MDQFKSNPTAFTPEESDISDIPDLEELISILTQAQESILQQKATLQNEFDGIHRRQMAQNPHYSLKEGIDNLLAKIGSLERFKLAKTTTSKRGENTRDLRFEIRHLRNKSMASERKVLTQLQQKETTRRQLEDAQITPPMRRYYNVRNAGNVPAPKPKSKMQIKNAIWEWAEEVENTSRLLLCDSKKLTYEYKTTKQLQHLNKHTYKLFESKVDYVKLMECWDSMKHVKTSFECIKMDLVKASKRHTKGYAEYKEHDEKKWALYATISCMTQECNDIYFNKKAAIRRLRALQNLPKSSTPSILN